MHRLIQDHLEEVLAESMGNSATGEHKAALEHLDECAECRNEVAEMKAQSALLRCWRAPQIKLEPAAGFYARVMERIEARGVQSIWQLFFDSFGRRIAWTSMAVALLLGVLLAGTEFSPAPRPQSVELVPAVQPELTLAAGVPDSDTVLVNLVTYRGQ